MSNGRWGLAVLVAATLVLAACGGDDGDGGGTLTTVPDVTTPLVTSPNGEPTREGEWQEIASGDDGGVTWTLSRASASGGGLCWKLDTEPELDLVLEPEHCNAPLPTDLASRAMLMDFPYSSGITTDRDIVVGAFAEPYTSAEFGFSDGSTAKPSYEDKDAGILVWAGPSRPVAAAVAVELEDGTKMGCGPGEVSSAIQLYELPEQRLVEERSHPWTCIEETD